MQKVSWLTTPQNIVVNFEGQTHMLSRKDAYAEKLIEALKSENWKEIPGLISQAKRIEKYSDGKFQVKDGEILVEGKQAHTVLANKIQEFIRDGLPYQPLVRFQENLQLNPSPRALSELYSFLEKNNHPITENGCFIAYKKVRPNFTDIHSGKFDNSVGQVVEVRRDQVDDNPNHTCSFGLHVANWDYAANHFGSASDIMLEVEVHPQDVVSIPVDYNQSKMRVCKYKVLGVVDQALSTPLRDTTKVSVESTEESEEEIAYCENCGEPVEDGCSELCSFCDE